MEEFGEKYSEMLSFHGLLCIFIEVRISPLSKTRIMWLFYSNYFLLQGSSLVEEALCLLYHHDRLIVVDDKKGTESSNKHHSVRSVTITMKPLTWTLKEEQTKIAFDTSSRCFLCHLSHNSHCNKQIKTGTTHSMRAWASSICRPGLFRTSRDVA